MNKSFLGSLVKNNLPKYVTPGAPASFSVPRGTQFAASMVKPFDPVAPQSVVPIDVEADCEMELTAVPKKRLYGSTTFISSRLQLNLDNSWSMDF
eukprot:gene12496-14668_t